MHDRGISGGSVHESTRMKEESVDCAGPFRFHQGLSLLCLWLILFFSKGRRCCNAVSTRGLLSTMSSSGHPPRWQSPVVASYSTCLDLGICTLYPRAWGAGKAHSQATQAPETPLAFEERVFPQLMLCLHLGMSERGRRECRRVQVGGRRGPCTSQMTFSPHWRRSQIWEMSR